MYQCSPSRARAHRGRDGPVLSGGAWKVGTVRTTLRCVEALVAALLCVAAVGACGGDDDGAQSVPAAAGGGGDESGDTAVTGQRRWGQRRRGQRRRAPGVPGGNSGGGAPGAPIDIPALQQVGAPIEQVIPSLEQAIRDACGGDLCLVLDDEDALQRARTAATSAPTRPEGRASSSGSTVVVVARCEGGSTGQTNGTDAPRPPGPARPRPPGTARRAPARSLIPRALHDGGRAWRGCPAPPSS